MSSIFNFKQAVNWMATLHLMVGLPLSGKTTYARRLEREADALRLTPDDWHIRLGHHYGLGMTEIDICI